MTVEVSPKDDAKLREKMIIENVSAHGIRGLVEQRLQPGEEVVISLPREGLRSRARIIYCQRTSDGKFAVGMELSRNVEEWSKPY